MRRLTLSATAAAALLLAACGSPAPSPTTPPQAPPDTSAASTAPPTATIDPLTLADVDVAGLAAAGYQENPGTSSTSVVLWQTSACTVQVLVEQVRITGDDRADSEAAFESLPASYTQLAPHRDVAIPLTAGGSLGAPAMAVQLTHADGSVTPALITMRVIGERESLLAVTQWCWDHAVTAEDFDAALASLALGGGIEAP